MDGGSDGRSSYLWGEGGDDGGPSVPSFVLAFERPLSVAPRPQPQVPAVRHRAGAPGARRWRTAPARVRADQPAAAGAGAAARPAAAAPVAGDPRIPGRNVAAAAAAAGHRARPRAGARTGAADRLRRAPAQQPA